MMPTRPVAWLTAVLTVPLSFTASAAARHTRTCPSFWVVSKAACDALRITITGATRCAVPSWSMPSVTCCSTATPSVRWSRSRIGWPVANLWRTSLMCAVPHSYAGIRPKAGSRSIPPRLTVPAVWTTTPVPIRPRPSARKGRELLAASRRHSHNRSRLSEMPRHRNRFLRSHWARPLMGLSKDGKMCRQGFNRPIPNVR